uniref:Formylmethanofuran dehydrogenase n=2 Tax=Geoglobus ahangari TaxID=113653 RepID=A0A7C3UK33_9EURY
MMPLQLAKFLKKMTVDVVVGRSSFQAEAADRGKFSEDFIEKSAVVYMKEDFAKINGFKEGDIVKLTRKGKSINLRVAIADFAPNEGIFIPNSIYASYLSDFDSFKRFKASLEPADGDVTKPEEIIQKMLK